MKQLSPDVRLSIISMLEAGYSCQKIALKLDVGHSTVSELHSQIATSIKKNVGGRPSKLTPADRRHMAHLISTGKADTATQLKRQLQNITNTSISTQSIRNALKKEDMMSRVKVKKPLLRRHHIKQRLEFAQKYEHWTEEDWARVIWSDETKVNRLGSDGRQWVWKKHGAPLTSQHVKPTVKFGGGNVMIWGCMTIHGVGYMCRIEGKMDAPLYEEILEDHVLETVRYYGMDEENFIFQQDNDSKHTSKRAQKWFKNHSIQILDWPAQSPDLNPIEHLWVLLKFRLAAYETEPKSIQELWERIEVEWEKIPKEECVNLIKSMPRRIAAVLKAKGGYTKY
jgi:transposase